MKILRPSNVPCNGCTACCEHDLIVLHPEMGDRVSEYQAVMVDHPLSGQRVWALRHRPEGGCVYLGEKGCTIHGRAPAICREFDCRKMVERFGVGKMKQVIRAGLADKEVMEAGLARLNTLPGRAA